MKQNAILNLPASFKHLFIFPDREWASPECGSIEKHSILGNEPTDTNILTPFNIYDTIWKMGTLFFQFPFYLTSMNPFWIVEETEHYVVAYLAYK